MSLQEQVGIPLPIILVGILIVGIVVYGFVRNQRDQRLKSELRQRGVKVTARVTRKQHDMPPRTGNDMNTGSDTYTVTCEYTVNGERYTLSQRVNPELYRQLREGEPLEVIYLPENPRSAWLARTL